VWVAVAVVAYFLIWPMLQSAFNWWRGPDAFSRSAGC